MTVGIDAIDYYFPHIYLPISALADARSIEYAKLNKGLGLTNMAVTDVNEDVATMAANAVIKLIKQKGLNLNEIGRIYLGTESALDAAKPTASYILQMVEKAFEVDFGKRALKNCDVVDLTFACIGGVDAMLNSLDWIRCGKNRKAIVVAADNAKYELGSGGEYTQGAGAVALLLSENPAIMTLEPEVGVATESVSDFFKPRRSYKKADLLKQAAQLLGQNITDEDLNQLLENNNSEFWGQPSTEVEIHKDEPVFDGPYSNDCYTSRITEALAHLQSQTSVNVLSDWSQLIFHLPYAYQGRRMIIPLWVDWMIENNQQEVLEKETGMAIPTKESTDWNAFIKACSKTATYKAFVSKSIEKGERASSEIGNMYTASIFMSLLSFLTAAAEEDIELEGKTIGFFSYGSGSKSKVFQGIVQKNWKNTIMKLPLFDELKNRTAIDFSAYENLHNGKLLEPIVNVNSLSLKEKGTKGVLTGYRFYH